METCDPFLAELEAVLEHRRRLVSVRTIQLEHVADQIGKLPTEIRDQLKLSGSIPSRLHQLENLDTTTVSTLAGMYRLSWLVRYIENDRQQASQVRALERKLGRVLDQHGTTLREEDGIGTISAATLLCEVGDILV